MADTSQLYIDNHGIIWQRIDDSTVWSREYGYGLWDNGKGLREYANA